MYAHARVLRANPCPIDWQARESLVWGYELNFTAREQTSALSDGLDAADIFLSTIYSPLLIPVLIKYIYEKSPEAKIPRYILESIRELQCKFICGWVTTERRDYLEFRGPPRRVTLSQVPRGSFRIRPAANMMRARGYVRYRRYRDMKKGTTGGKEERHRKAPSYVVLFQVCIRFVFQPIILTRSSAPSLSRPASKKVLTRATKYTSLPEKIPEGHKRRTAGPEVEKTRQGPRRRHDRGRTVPSSRISIANHNILLLTCRGYQLRNILVPLSIKLLAATR